MQRLSEVVSSAPSSAVFSPLVKDEEELTSAEGDLSIVINLLPSSHLAGHNYFFFLILEPLGKFMFSFSKGACRVSDRHLYKPV